MRCARAALAWLATLALLQTATSARAVIIDSGDGSGNLAPPRELTAWRNLGTSARKDLGVVYLGDGWVLTAYHVGVSSVVLRGITYPPDYRTAQRVPNPDGSLTDILLYRIRGAPDLPDLPHLELTDATPRIGTEAVLIGRGRDRGERFHWIQGSGAGLKGWHWAPGTARRWGTNLIEGSGVWVPIGPSSTRALMTVFDPRSNPTATHHEMQAALGDSGGALFVKDGGDYALAGLVFAVSTFPGQPDDTAVYGNATYAADLAFYRDAILAIVRPQPALDVVPVGPSDAGSRTEAAPPEGASRVADPERPEGPIGP